MSILQIQFDPTFYLNKNSKARFWMEQIEDRVIFHRGEIDKQKKNDNIGKICQILKDHEAIVSQLMQPTSDLACSFLEINSIVERHNLRIDSMRFKILRWIVGLPLIRTVMALFINTRPLKESLVSYQSLTIPESQSQSLSVESQSTIYSKLFGENDWNWLKTQMQVADDETIIYRWLGVNGIGFLVVLREPTTNRLIRLTIRNHIEENNVEFLVKVVKNFFSDVDFKAPGEFKFTHPDFRSIQLVPDISRDLTDAEWDKISSVDNNSKIIMFSESIYFMNECPSKFSDFQMGFLEYARNTIQNLLTQEEINSRFWKLIEMRKTHRRDYIFCESTKIEGCYYATWLIIAMSKLVNNFREQEVTVDDFEYYYDSRFDHLVIECLKFPHLAQSSKASKFLEKSLFKRYSCALEFLKSNVCNSNYKELTESFLHGITLKSDIDQEFTAQLLYKENIENDMSLAVEILNQLISRVDDAGLPNSRFSPSILETAYSLHNIPPLFSISLKHAKTVPLLFLEKMKREFEKGNTTFAEPFYKKGFLTFDEYKAYTQKSGTVEESDEASMKGILIRSCNELTAALKYSNIAQDVIDFKKVAYWKTVKKSAKKKVNKNDAIYCEFIRLYDRLIEKHPLLSTLREVSREIRHLRIAPSTVSLKLTKMVALWGDVKHRALSTDRIVEIVIGDSNFFRGLYQRIFQVATRYFADPEWYASRDIWVHGTKSPALEVMLKTKQKALIATGTLLKQGIAPLTGEICGSDKSINATQISGETFTPNFQTETKEYMNAGTRLLVSICYAAESNHYHLHHMAFDPVESWARVTPDALLRLLNGMDVFDSWSLLHVDILRLRMTDREADQKLLGFKEKVNECLKSPYGFKGNLNSILAALERPMQIFLDSEDVKKISRPYPILFACPDAKPKSKNDVSESDYNEHLIEEGAALGREIRMVFADNCYLPELQKTLSKENVKIESFDMAYMLETMHMIRGSAIEPTALEGNEDFVDETLDAILQKDILPAYAAMLPEKPVCVVNKTVTAVLHPFYGKPTSSYQDYKRKVEDGQILPRDIHGCMHATRTVLWSQLLARLYIKHGRSVESLLLLGITAGKHDTARMDEGEDVYESASAADARAYLKRYGLASEVLDKYTHCIEHKDPLDGVYADVEHEIVHDADCLEILRLLPLERFIDEELCFGQLDGLSREDKMRFVKEVKAFVDQTEDIQIKQQLEWYSQHYYLDLVNLLRKTHLDTNCYPFICNLMGK